MVLARLVGLFACLFLISSSCIGAELRRTATIHVNGNPIIVEMVFSQNDQVQGLGGRNLLLSRAGMLFVFPKPDRYGIWMREMRFPLDILWFSADRRVIYFLRNIQPDTFPQIFYPPSAALYILELNAGSIDKMQIKEGQTMILQDPSK